MSTDRIRAGRRWSAIGTGIVALLLTGWFCVTFDPGHRQVFTDLLWVASLLLWAVAWTGLSGAGARAIGRQLREAWPLAVFLVVLALVWLPFYNNWRWAQTGDSIAWYSTGVLSARNGLWQNALSVHGPDENATYLSALVLNFPLFLVKPTFFWHRVGKLVVSCLSLIAVWSFFWLWLGRRWALFLVLLLATNYIWIRFSYVSDHLVETHFFAYLVLACATMCLRRPEKLGPWMWCGLVSGLSLFFPQTAWATVMAVGLVLAARALATRRPAPLLLAGASFLLAAAPALLQWRDLVEMSAHQAHSIFAWSYLKRIFVTILQLPLTSPNYTVGGHGAFLRWPLGHLYAAGTALAVVGILPPLRRRLRIPAVSAPLLGLLLWEVCLMTLTNNAYGEPSLKRSFHLLPLQLFFAMLPLYVLSRLAETSFAVRRSVAALVVAVTALYTNANCRILAHPRRAMYGTNAFDGLIEIRQRFPTRRVLLATTRPEHIRDLGPDSFFQHAYGLAETVETDSRLSDATVQRACSDHRLLCYEPKMEGTRFDPVIERHAAVLTRFPLLNTTEMLCYECERVPGST